MKKIKKISRLNECFQWLLQRRYQMHPQWCLHDDASHMSMPRWRRTCICRWQATDISSCLSSERPSHIWRISLHHHALCHLLLPRQYLAMCKAEILFTSRVSSHPVTSNPRRGARTCPLMSPSTSSRTAAAASATEPRSHGRMTASGNKIRPMAHAIFMHRPPPVIFVVYVPNERLPEISGNAPRPVTCLAVSARTSAHYLPHPSDRHISRVLRFVLRAIDAPVDVRVARR